MPGLDISTDIDGRHSLEYGSDGVYVTVFPSAGRGKPVAFESLLEILRNLEIKGIDSNALREAVRTPSQRVKIAEYQEPVVRDGKTSVEVERDGMTAYLLIYPPLNGKPVDMEQAQEALRRANVSVGIDEDALHNAVLGSEKEQKIIIARGIVPQNGQDARIEYKFTPQKRIRPQEMEDGRVDFYNLNLVHNVNFGEILAIRTPPTEGVRGMTVTGKEIPTKAGKDYRLPAGKGTDVSPDGTLLLASTMGHVHIVGDKIVVDPVFELKGDVDLSSGNINFVGSVVIKGSVTYGFSITCEGDLDVGGSIDGGTVTVGGNVHVKQGIQGQYKSVVQAKGNVLAKFIENATVKSGEDVVVGEGIMHSNIDAGKSIIVGGKKGVIVGGHCRATEEISGKIIGSPHATATQLEVGVRPERRQEFTELCEKHRSAADNYDKTEKALRVLRELERRHGQLPEDKKILMLKLTRTQFQLMKDLEELTKAREEMEHELEQVNRGKIRAGNLIYPGVMITIGQFTTRVRESVQFCTVSIDKGEFTYLPYNS